jgi:hypothetical protein
MSSSTSPPLTHPALSALALINEGLDELGDANLWSLTDNRSLEVRVELERLTSRLSAARLRSTHDVDSRGAAVSAGAMSLTAWLVNRVRMHPGDAAREMRLAAVLDRELPIAAAAMTAGEITASAVSVIADTDTALSSCATAAQRTDAEGLLVEHARTLPIRGLQAAALHLRHRFDPEHGDRLTAEEERQVSRRAFRLRMTPTGRLARTVTSTRRPLLSCARPSTR